MTRELSFTVEPGAGGRADQLVAARFPGAGRRRIAALFSDGAVRVDGKRARKGQTVAPGSVIELARAPATTDEELWPVAVDSVAVTLLFADDDLVAVDKPAGVPSHPLAAGERGTVANWLAARYPDTVGVGNDPREAGLVHRLDIGTSGVLVATRSRPMWELLRAAFGRGDVSKLYLAEVDAGARDGACDAPLHQRGHHVAVDWERGLDAETRWHVIDRRSGSALVECTARSGRMHQIRAHLAHVGWPITGDALYGGRPLPDGGAYRLHALRLELPHPRTGARLTIEAPRPPWAATR